MKKVSREIRTREDRSVGWPVNTTSAWDSVPTGYCYKPFNRAAHNQLKSVVKTPLTIIVEKQQRFQKRKQTDWFGGDWQSAHHAFHDTHYTVSLILFATPQ